MVCLINTVKPKLTILQNHEEEYSLHQAIENLHQNTRLTYINIYKNLPKNKILLHYFRLKCLNIKIDFKVYFICTKANCFW